MGLVTPGLVTPPRAILTDIEGTTTPIAFVRDTLFPFAYARMADFLATHAGEPRVASVLDETRALAPGHRPLDALRAWMDADAKVTPLKTLQGMIWEAGYADGTLTGALYPDVAPALRAWHAAGVTLAVYSSGSIAAQRLLFGRSVAGDLASLFAGFFDTTIGGKREAGSYAGIARVLDVPPAELLFLSDIEAELDAAASSGLRTTQMVRAADGTAPAARHLQAADFAEATALHRL